MKETVFNGTQKSSFAFLPKEKTNWRHVGKTMYYIYFLTDNFHFVALFPSLQENPDYESVYLYPTKLISDWHKPV